jgi:hypothetical protein
MEARNLQLATTLFSMIGQQMQGRSAAAAANSQAAQLDVRAGQSRAIGQRGAQEERRKAALVASRLQAVAGGGASDPTVVKLASDIAGEGEYRAMTALYEGEEAARGDENAASVARATGKAARRASNIGTVSNMFSGGSTLYTKYK